MLEKKIALFGGTFDPIHEGHLHIAKLAYEKLALDQIIFLPCRQSPHKLGKKSAAEQHRKEMCKLATTALPWATVNDYDLVTPPPSYSWKTAAHFKQQFKESKLFWLMGTDQWQALERWANYEQLATLVDFIVCTRGDEKLIDRAIKPHVITCEHEASATIIRQQLTEQQAAQWLHSDVAAYLTKHQLYC